MPKEQPNCFLIIKEPPFSDSYNRETYIARTLEEMQPWYSYAEYKSQVRFLIRQLPASPDELNSLITQYRPNADLDKTMIQSFEDTNGGKGVRVSIFKKKTIEAKAEVTKKEDSIKKLNSQLIEAMDLDKVKMLLTKGADVNAKDSNGKTALMNAAYYGHKEIVRFLLEHGANVNERYVDGCTALIWAAGEGEAETLEILLQHGADVYATERHNHTALMIANRMNKTKVASILDEWEKAPHHLPIPREMASGKRVGWLADSRRPIRAGVKRWAALILILVGVGACILLWPSLRQAWALRHRDPDIRRAAVQKVTDRALLARISKTDASEDVRVDAALMLADQRLLAEILKASQEMNWARLCNPDDVLSKDVATRRALDGLSEESLVLEVVESARSPVIRRAAAAKLTDTVILRRIALNNSEPMLRWATVERLADQTLLNQIAKTDSDNRVRRAAIAGISDQAALIDIAQSDSDPKVRTTAIRTLSGQNVVAELEVNVKVDSFSGDSSGEWESIPNRSRTSAPGDNAQGPGAAQRAHITAVLSRIAETDSDSSVREAAVNALTSRRKE